MLIYRIGNNTTHYIKKPDCAFNFSWTLWSVTMTLGNCISFKLRGCGLDTTTGRLLWSGIFGAVIIFSVWGFAISEMGDKLPIGGSEDEFVCDGGYFMQEDFVLNHLQFIKWSRN